MITIRNIVADNWDSLQETYKLETQFTPATSVACNTVQTAIQMCLEIMGTRSEIVPIVMPITSPPDTVCAALRSGGQPFLLDIDPDTLQIQAEQLTEALASLENAVVILTRPGGLEVSQELLDLTEHVTTIVDTRLVPHGALTASDLCGTFNIFDFFPLAGSGSLICSTTAHIQAKHLRLVRSGVMGHDGAMAAPLVRDIQKQLTYWNTHTAVYSQNLQVWKKELKSMGIRIYGPSHNPGPLLVHVPEAQKLSAHLHSYKVEASLGVYPLYRVPEIRERYKEDPEYPVAEELSNHVLCLPTNQGVSGLIPQLCNYMREVL